MSRALFLPLFVCRLGNLKSPPLAAWGCPALSVCSPACSGRPSLLCCSVALWVHSLLDLWASIPPPSASLGSLGSVTPILGGALGGGTQLCAAQLGELVLGVWMWSQGWSVGDRRWLNPKL